MKTSYFRNFTFHEVSSALLCAGGTAAIQSLLTIIFGYEASFLLCTLAVCWAAWIGGMRSGMLTTLLCILIEKFFFIPPYYSFFGSIREDKLQATLFLVIGGIISILQSSLKKTRQELQESERRLQTIVDNEGTIVYVKDLEGRFVFVNRYFQELFKFQKEQILGKNDYDLFPKDLAENFREHDRKVLRQGKLMEFEEIARHPEGQHFYLSLKFPLRTTKGEVYGLCGISTDITQRKMIEEKLRESTEALTALVHGVQDYILVMLGPEGNICTWGMGGTYITQFTEEELKGRHFSQLFSLEEQERDTPCMILTLAQSRGRYEGTSWKIKKDNTQYLSHDIVTPLLTEDGQLKGFVQVTRNITAEHLSEKRFEIVVEASPNALILTSPKGIIELVNSQAEKVFHYSRDELIGKPVEVLIPQRFRGHHPSLRNEFQQMPNARPMGKGRDLFGLTKEGLEVPVEVGLTPIALPDGVHVLTSIVDITDRRHLEEEKQELLTLEQKAREEAERANKMKDEFLAMLSHELRTPLNAMLGWTQLLRRNPPSEQRLSQGLEVIERNIRTQIDLINDLLDMSRVAKGKLSLQLQQVDFLPVVKETIETMRPTAREKNIRLELTVEGSLELIRGDRSRLQQIVWNLLSNAIKFSAPHEVITVALSSCHQFLVLSVKDQGEGIEKEALSQIFERFHQEDASTTRKHGGLGLGLSIVKQLVLAHGGTIEGKSEGKGKGATFIVRLPITYTEKQEPLLELPLKEANHRRLEGIHVLLVDDHIDTLTIMKQLLEEAGAVVVTAPSAEEALNLLQSSMTPPTVLISDLAMPQEDGCSLLHKIRQLPPEKGGVTPAVAVTAYAEQETRSKALECGFQEYLSKPVEPDKLFQAVERLAM